MLGGSLEQYNRLKAEIAVEVQMAFHVAADNQAALKRGCQDLLARLAEDRFVLAVVGQFNRGKSSLMNALMGMDRLPVGIVPLTSVLTTVSYGNPEHVSIEYGGRTLATEIPISQLPDYVTEAGNPGNRRNISTAMVRLPAELLRHGFWFVDTPGTGSAIAANTATTERFLSEADAVVFVTSFEGAMTRDEIQLLASVREHLRTIFIAVNKADLAPAGERTRVLDFIAGILESELGITSPLLFAVSARQALRAKLDRCAESLAESGLPALEESLISFMTTQKAAEALVRVCDRAIALLAEALGSQGVADKGRPQLERVVSRLAAIREQLIGGTPLAGVGQKPDHTRAHVSPEDLADAVRRPCPVCARVGKAVVDFLAGLQHRFLVDDAARKANADRGGLCPLHTWQYAEIASPRGISFSYAPVLRAASAALAQMEAPDAARRIRVLLAGPARCPVCRERVRVEGEAVAEIIRSWEARGGRSSPRMPPLCLPHLALLLSRDSDPSLREAALAFASALFARTAENMERYSLKHDALRRGSVTEDERSAYGLGLSQLVGSKQVCFPWHIDEIG